ncbi:Ig-like domain-containing protein [Shewanella sp. SM69]|uniref:Ig-like domain-containing protein n=1 Tax=Shewanella sp. SM69 TaxID=2912802 RepID=UPI0021DAFFFF|nr:Ig-like domain-containing protein [Shewanella sp. SM69]MCU8039933.1 Ig-like domain-containing protein [Shewanella sp. SM69]
MRHALLSGLSSLLLPFGLYGAGAIAAPSYQRSYLSSSISASTDLLLRSDTSLPQDLIDLSGDQLDIQSAHPVRELVIVDGAVAEADKSVLRRALKPSVQLVELDSSIAGLPQLINVLDGHKNLAAIHVVSHAQAGVILLGNSRITPETIQQEVQAFAALKGAVREGGDLLFYGCDLAANESGEALLDIISNNTGLDVAASNNLTGNAELQGDWDLEVTRGNIESTLVFSEKALRDFSEVLAPIVDGTYDFAGWSGQGTAQLSTTHFRLTAKGGDGVTQNLGNGLGNFAYMHGGATSTNHYFYLRADGTNTTAFELTGLTGGEYAGYSSEFTNLRIVGYLQSGGTVTSSVVNGVPGAQNFAFGAGQLGSFSGVKLKGFKLFFDCASACTLPNDGPENFEFRSFTVANAIDTPPLPTVSDARIGISGASGTSGAYKIGDIVTATWNNTAGGDNNSGVTGVTVDFSQFGGGAAVAATDSSGTWTATYVITSGAIDASSRNVSVTATNAQGGTTTADTTNAVVDNVAPVVTDNRLGLSGATGTGGAYKIGDTVTATWNNTAGGDNNSDTISSATVNFSQFGGGAAVAATNSSGAWTATYTIVAGAIDTTNRNISFSATDNAGNNTTTADTSNATLDNVAPFVSDVYIGISGGTGTAGTFIAGDTVTASWDNSAIGDDNSDTISAATVDFSQFGGGAVAATNNSGTWTAIYTLVAGAINTTNRNVSVTATDNAGNTRTQADSSNATVDNVVPAVTSVSVPANATYITGQSLDFTVNTSEAIIVGGTPRIALTLGASTVYASYLSGTGSSALTFRYTVQSGDFDTDGIAIAGSIEANGGTLKEGSGNTLNLVLNSIGSTTAVLVDAVPPTVSSVTVPTDNTYAVGDTLSFTVSSTENVTVNTGGGTPRIVLTIGGTTRYALYISGSGTSNLVFSYAVQAGDNDTDGIGLASSIDANGGALLDGAGNNLALTLNSVGSTTAILVDTATPTVQSFNPLDGAIGVAVGANFVLTMNEDIQLGSGNIVIYNTDDVAVATIDVGSPVGQLTITAGVLTINPAANLVENTSYYIQIANGAITDLAGNLYAGISNKTDWNFTVADVTPPVVTGIVVTGSPAANGTSLVFTVSFDEVASNLSTDDFVLTATGSASGSIASVSAASGTSVDVTVNTVSGTGSLRLDVKANSNIQDASGNGNGTNGYTAAYTGGASHTVDRDAPLAPSGLDLATASDSGISSTDNLTSDTTPTLTGNAEANSAVTLMSSIDGVLGTTTADGSGNWSFTTPLLTSNSAHNITATATDVAGNTGAVSTALVLTLDTQIPTITSSAPAVGAAAADASVIFNLAFSESVNSLTTDDFALASTGTASGTISSVSASSGTGVVVTVNGISGTGSLKVGHTTSDIVDDAGNALGTYSAGTAHSVDTDAPTISGVSFDQTSVTQANQNAISLTLASAEVGTSANYTITGSSGTPVAGSIAVASASQQIVNIDVSALGDGTLTVSLTLTDAAGNVSSPAVTDTISKDAVIPAVNVVNVNDGHYGVGSAIDITLTLTEDVTVSGTLSTLSLDIDGVARQAVFVSAASGVLTYRYTVQAGDNTGASGLIVDANGIALNGDTMRDAGSNDADLSYSQWNSVNVIVDTTAPVDPVVTTPAGAISTNQATTLISGTHAEDGVTISLYADVNNDGVADNATVLDDTIVVAGAWTLSAALSTDSDNNFVVVASDAASNVSAPQNVPTITQDATVPVAPSAPDLDAASDSGVSSTDNITKNTTLILTGTAEAGASVVLSSHLDGVLGTVNADGSGDWSVNATSVSPGTHSITAVATDIAGNSSVASSALSVTIDTSAPTSSAIAHQNIQPGESSSTLAFTIADDVTAATDILVTPASSDTTVVPLAGVVLVGSEADRGVTVTALGSGTSTITLTLVDIAGNTSTRSFDVVVNSVPTILGTPATNVAQGTLYNFMPIAADADGNSLVFDITNRPSWAGFNTATGALSGTPSNADVGMTTAIVISVSDGVLSASLPAFNLTVTNVNDAPTISSTAMTAATQDAAYSYSLTAIDSDVGDVLTLSAVTKPSWLSFNSVTGLLSGTPSNADVGGHAVLLRVTDTDGLTADQSFSITVTNSNDAPTITSTATMAAVQDAVYSYTFAATDVDVDDVLTFSAVTIPSWLSFNAATGLLSGTPGNADVGSHAVTLRVTDTDGLTAEQSFSITVTNVNDAPVATSASVTLEEDSSVMITLTGEDADSDPLTYEVVSQPESGTLEQHGTVWLYTPEKDFNGADQISFIAKDAELSSEPATITMNVTPVNDDPQAVDDNYTLASTADDKYTLPALENDVDVDGDTLTIDGAAADIGSVQITDDGLIFTAPAAYVGPVALRYTISDGQKGRASAKVNLLVEGGEADNLPVITVPSDVEVNATGLFTRVDLGFAKAVDRNGHPLPVSLVDKRLFFAPGSYLAYWQAVDRDGNKATKAQKVKVHPLISLSKDQVVGEGNEVVVSIHLNGVAPEYPISVPYTVAGSADSNDHDLVDAVVEITSGTLAHIHFRTIEDGEVEAEEEVLISLDPSLNLGSKKQTQVSITEANIAPSVTLEVTQAGERQLIVAQNGGEVHIHAQISDANMNDTLTSVWSSGALNLQSDDAGMFFLPTEVLPGIYPVSLTVTDSGLPALSTTEKVYIVVRPSLPPLTGTDTDGDLIPDNQEGFTDTDRDGIPDYLDAINDCNVMPEGELQPVYFLAEGQAGVCLRLGNIALMQEQSGIQLLPNLVPEDSIAANVGGIFDFIATGLPQQGQSYSLVIPQRSPVPANAVYRKYQAQNGWKDFVIDARNSVASSEGERGFCPPPGDSRWTSGLTEGHWCVQLTIEDGGPNDDDGVANRTIVDPSGVSVILNGNHLPVANPDTASLPWNQSLDVDVLANDTDSDGDALTVTQVTSEFGTVVILANQQLSYTPATDFIGTDVLVYSITDGKGGTASSELTVIVNGNTAPTTVNDSAAIDDRTSLLLDVLSNDSDPDGNVLTLVSATAQQGTVSVESNKLRYIPKTGFDGVDTVSYQISDGLGGEATGQALITVKAYQNVVIDNKSGGGSMSLWALGLILTMGLIRRKELHKLVLGAVLLVGSVNQANAADNWYVEGFVGQAQVDNSRRDLQPQAGTGFVTSVDDKDTALGVSIGYQWTPFVAIELGYADFGNGSARIEGASLTPEQYHEQVKAVTPVLADGVMLGLRFTLLQHEAWRFEVPIGLFRWQADISSTMGNSRLTTELDGTDWYAGVRFSYQFSDSWSVGLGYQYVDIEPNDFLSYQLNLRYQF